jgi:type II secretory pathway component PulM
MQKIGQYWQARSSSEQRLLSCVGILLLLLLLYLFGHAWQKNRRALQQKLPQLQQDWQRVQGLVSEIQLAQTHTSVTVQQEDGVLFAQRMAKMQNMTVHHAQLRSNYLELEFVEVDSVAWQTWLLAMQEAGWRVQQLDMQAASAGGVNVRLQLTQQGL